MEIVSVSDTADNVFVSIASDCICIVLILYEFILAVCILIELPAAATILFIPVFKLIVSITVVSSLIIAIAEPSLPSKDIVVDWTTITSSIGVILFVSNLKEISLMFPSTSP